LRDGVRRVHEHVPVDARRSMARRVTANRSGWRLVALGAGASIVAASTMALLVPLGGAANLQPAVAGRPSQDPAAFLSRVVAQIVRNDYAHAWSTLHPAHQRVAPRSEYVDCEMLTPFTATLRSVEVLSVKNVRLRISGLARRVSTAAVRLRLRTVEAGTGVSVGIATLHAIRVNGRWRWVLTPERYELYRLNACGLRSTQGRS
jgi:hypothetical protein